AVVLLWQWTVSLSLPWLERRLIYADTDYDQLEKIQQLSRRLLTRADLLQLQEATLSAVCDYLQVGTSFVVALTDLQPELIASVGPTRPNDRLLADEAEAIVGILETNLNPNGLPTSANPPVHKWNSYWIVPLRSTRTSDHNGDDSLIGFIGIQARSAEVNLTLDERQVFRSLVRRVAQTLDDLALQDEIYASLEGLLPQLRYTRSRTSEVEYRAGRQPALPDPEGTSGNNAFALPDPLLDREQFVEQVKAALRHYWGGPGLTKSRLLDLNVVRAALPENDNNPAKALRSVLLRAIQKQRPEGERRMTSPEWTIYNILEMRFIDKRSVRDSVRAIAVSEPDLYRKQRVAIDAVADALFDMEQTQELPPPSNGQNAPDAAHDEE
ncbi:MAG: hypothetical protein H7175_19740, partial [Burkholderiales bacterium]|nr:hypothetical protein [Anaerolineae bacterium]